MVDEGGVVMLLVESDLHLLWAARRPQFKRGLVGLSTMFPKVPYLRPTRNFTKHISFTRIENDELNAL